MTLLPNSEQTGNLDNLAVTRAEFRAEIGELLEYMAQALGSVSGTYTTETVDPFDPELQGTPTLEVGAEPVTGDSTLRIPTTQWVKKSGRYVGKTPPASPELGMLWINSSTNPFTVHAYDGAAWDIVSGVPSGTRMLFQQTAAPVGWTKDTSNDNVALRVTSGTVSSGGSLNFTAAFNSALPLSGSIGGTSLTIAQMPSHSHGITDPGHKHSFVNARYRVGQGSNAQTDVTNRNGTEQTNNAYTGISVQANGGGDPHTHSFAGTDLNLDVMYVDVIVAVKN